MLGVDRNDLLRSSLRVILIDGTLSSVLKCSSFPAEAYNMYNHCVGAVI